MMGPAAPDNSTNELALAGLLGALGLAAVGGVAFLASRRRRRDADGLGDETTAYAPVETEEVVERPVATTAIPNTAAYAAPVAMRSSAASTDPVALPSDIPATYAERDALLKDLVAAEPDRANPFRSPSARARRAKLIIQSLGRRFETRKPRIDLSQYSHRWPALRGWQPATA